MNPNKQIKNPLAHFGSSKVRPYLNSYDPLFFLKLSSKNRPLHFDKEMLILQDNEDRANSTVKTNYVHFVQIHHLFGNVCPELCHQMDLQTFSELVEPQSIQCTRNLSGVLCTFGG